VTTRQPVWETVFATDYNRVDVDTTGVYPPELTIGLKLGDDQYVVYRFSIEQCTFIDGILSDNKFHPDHPAWFADSIEDSARSSGVPVSELIDFLCSSDAGKLASAYETIGSYHGFDNFDGYPLIETEEEFAARLDQDR
jgi:hypothetical protein